MIPDVLTHGGSLMTDFADSTAMVSEAAAGSLELVAHLGGYHLSSISPGEKLTILDMRLDSSC